MLAERAREVGAVPLSDEKETIPGPLLKKLLNSMSGAVADKKEETKVQKTVHLVKNLQPLPKKIVEAIQDGIFVEFAWFPVLEEGPSEGDWKESPGECSESPGQSSGRKKEWKEVPDLSKWSTCFSLFQAAWAKHKPEMWLPLTAYREIIFKLARRHPWAQVVKYDRRFHQEAAGRDDAKWDEERVPLVVDLLCSSSQSKGDGKMSGNGNGTLQKKGACFRFNRASGNCLYGQNCKFAHVCSGCGGEHPLLQCSKNVDRKTA